MIVSSAGKAFNQLFTPGFRAVLWKSLGITIALLIGIWFLFEAGISTFLLPLIGEETWTASILSWILGAGLIIGLGFLIAPVTSVFGGFFIDDIADFVEQKHYPNDPAGQPLPTSTATILSLKFTLLVIGTNLLALLLLLVPGVNLIIFFVANGYLLGREYYQFAALRHLSPDDADDLRHKAKGTVFVAGLAIAGFLSIPLLNLLTPIFAAAFMTHVFKKLQRKFQI